MSLPCRTDRRLTRWVAGARGAKPKRQSGMADRSVPTVRESVRRGAGGRGQRSRSDGAGDRRRARPPGVRMVLLKGHGRTASFSTPTSRAPRASSSPQIRGQRCSSTGSRCAARCASKARSSGVTDAEADAYFATRARDSQLGAWASEQSRPLDSRGDVRGALRRDEAAIRGQATFRARRTGAAIA